MPRESQDRNGSSAEHSPRPSRRDFLAASGGAVVGGLAANVSYPRVAAGHILPARQLANSAQAVVGTTPDAQYPPSDSGIRDALRAGYRWLILTDFNYDMLSVINLDEFGGGTLRLEGAGPNITHLNRKFTGGPLIGAFGTLWRLYFDGITFNGDKDQYNNPQQPTAICEFRSLQLSRFENCMWVNGATQLRSSTAVSNPTEFPILS